MNPYDAILEQIQRAQRRGVETVSNRLDFVLESLEAIINEAREAVKEAVPDEPDELFPIAECSRAVEEARSSLEASEARAEELEKKVKELEDAVAEAESRAGGALDLDVLRRLDSARSQSELLKELLPALVDHVGRAAVLVVREGTVSAWSGIGFKNGEKLRTWNARVAESAAFEKLVHEVAVVRFLPSEDGLFASWLEGEALPSEAIIIPVSLRGRIVGGIYADRLEGAPWNTESAQAMVAAACWLIDTLAFRSSVPSPPLQEPVVLIPVDAEGPSGEAAAEEAGSDEEPTPESGYPAVAESEDFRQEPPESAEVPETGAEAEPIAEAPGAPSAEEISGQAAEEPVSEGSSEGFEAQAPSAGWAPEPAGAPAMDLPAETVEIKRDEGWTPPGDEAAGAGPEQEEEEEEEAPSGVEEAAPPREGVVAPPSVETVTPPGEAVPPPPVEREEPVEMETASPPPVAPVAPPPVSPVMPPPPVSPVMPPPPEEPGFSAQEVSEEDPRHEEARRFARLLVSEIKLYNPDEVENGQANNDIYQRLKEDIDRSREMYDRRVAEDIRASHDYFREALIRILANGDDDALGM